MRTTVTILILVLVGCGEIYEGAKPIVRKSHVTELNNPLPTGICKFTYYTGSGNYVFFSDSCHFYRVGDTLNFKLKM